MIGHRCLLLTFGGVALLTDTPGYKDNLTDDKKTTWGKLKVDNLTDVGAGHLYMSVNKYRFVHWSRTSGKIRILSEHLWKNASQVIDGQIFRK